MRTLRRKTAALLLLALLRLSTAIYPDDQWKYSTYLTDETIEHHIVDELAQGRTLFIRFIASPK